MVIWICVWLKVRVFSMVYSCFWLRDCQLFTIDIELWSSLWRLRFIHRRIFLNSILLRRHLYRWWNMWFKTSVHQNGSIFYRWPIDSNLSGIILEPGLKINIRLWLSSLIIKHLEILGVHWLVHLSSLLGVNLSFVPWRRFVVRRFLWRFRFTSRSRNLRSIRRHNRRLSSSILLCFWRFDNSSHVCLLIESYNIFILLIEFFDLLRYFIYSLSALLTEAIIHALIIMTWHIFKLSLLDIS